MKVLLKIFGKTRPKSEIPWRATFAAVCFCYAIAPVCTQTLNDSRFARVTSHDWETQSKATAAPSVTTGIELNSAGIKSNQIIERALTDGGYSTPRFDTHVKNAPSFDTHVKDTPIFDTYMKDTPRFDTFVKDTPTFDTFVKDTPSFDTYVKDTPIFDKYVKEKSGFDTYMKDMPKFDTYVKDTPRLDETYVKDTPSPENDEHATPIIDVSSSYSSERGTPNFDDSVNLMSNVDTNVAGTFRSSKSGILSISGILATSGVLSTSGILAASAPIPDKARTPGSEQRLVEKVTVNSNTLTLTPDLLHLIKRETLTLNPPKSDLILQPSQSENDKPFLTKSPLAVPSGLSYVVPFSVSAVVPSVLSSALPSELSSVVPSGLSSAAPLVVPSSLLFKAPSHVVPSGLSSGVSSKLPSIAPYEGHSEITPLIHSELSSTTPAHVSSTKATHVSSTGQTHVPPTLPTNVSSILLLTALQGVTSEISSIVPNLVQPEVSTIVPSFVQSEVQSIVTSLGLLDVQSIVPSLVLPEVSSTESSSELTEVSSIVPSLVQPEVQSIVLSAEPLYAFDKYIPSWWFKGNFFSQSNSRPESKRSLKKYLEAITESFTAASTRLAITDSFTTASTRLAITESFTTASPRLAITDSFTTASTRLAITESFTTASTRLAITESFTTASPRLAITDSFTTASPRLAITSPVMSIPSPRISTESTVSLLESNTEDSTPNDVQTSLHDPTEHSKQTNVEGKLTLNGQTKTKITMETFDQLTPVGDISRSKKTQSTDTILQPEQTQENAPLTEMSKTNPEDLTTPFDQAADEHTKTAFDQSTTKNIDPILHYFSTNTTLSPTATTEFVGISPPSSVIVPKELRIAWLAGEDTRLGFTALTTVNVLRQALHDSKRFLPNSKLRVKWYDTKCTPKASLAAAVDARQDFNPHMILGPPCSSGMDIVAMLAAHWNIPVFGWVSNGHTLADRTIYSTLVRVMGPLNHFSSSMNHVNVVFKWRTFALIHDVNEAYKSVNEAISMFLKKANNTVTSEHSVSPTQEDKKVEEMFQQIRKYARVLVFSVPWLTMRKYMLVAHRLGMTEGDFVFICINADIYSPSVLHRDILSDVGWRRNDPHDEEARIAFESVILIMMAVSNLEVYGTFEQYVNTASRLQSPDWELPTGNESFDAYAPFIYDATTLWASVVNKTLAEGGDPMNGTRICDLTKEITRTGITGKVVIDNNGDRLSNIWFLDMASNGKFSEIIKITKDLRGALLETSDNVRWPNGMMGNENAPPDTPVCGFEGELCKKKEEIPPPPDYTDSIVGAAAGSSFVFIVAVVVQVSLRHYRRRRQLESLLWQVRFDEIDFVTALLSGSVRSSFRNLARRRATSSKKVNKVRTAVSLQNPNNLQDTVNLNDAVTGLQHLFEAGSVMFGSVAYVRGSLVSVKRISQESVSLTKDLLQQLNKLMELKHQNITAFVGACVDPGRILLLWEYCPKGSLQDIIWNQNIKLDQLFKFALCQDVTKGLEYIHKSAVNYHGNLKSSNCVVDSRWTCKLTDFGVPKLRAVVKAAIPVEENFDKEFWTAPEVLRGQREVDLQKSDIFSLGVIFKEVFTRSSAYVEFNFMNPYDIIERVKTPRDSLFRPLISREVKQNQELSQLIADCWAEDPGVRPSASRLLKMLSKLNPSKHMTMIDNMLAMLEKYANHLEELVAERTSELDAEKRKTENLLYRMLPQSVAEDLKLGKPVKAELFDQVTIYFSDIVGFTGICSESTPIEVVNLLNSLYTLFDDIITGYDVYKVETIGDAYMLASGLPKRNGSQHTKEIANASLDILASIGNFRIPHLPDRKLRIRIGIHTGPVVAGVVGLAMPRYCLFGDAVNTASRMESTGLPLRIHMSHSAKESLQSFSGYHIEYRGEIEVKGKGKMQTYFLKGSDNFYKILPNPDIYTEHSPKMATRNVTSAPNFDNVKDSSPTETSRLKVSESFLLTKPELALIQDIKTYSAKLRRSDSVRSRENIYSRQSFTEHFRRRCSADEGEMPYRVNVISGSALTSEHRSGDCYDVIETPPEGRGVNSAGETNSSSKTTSLEGSGLEKSREALRTKERKGQGQTSDFDDSRTVTDKDAQQLETSHPPSLNPDENLSTGQIIKSCLKTGKHEQTRIGRTDRRLSVEFAIQDDQMDYLFGPKSPDCNNSNLGGKNESALRPLEMTANIFEPIRNGLKSLEEKFIQSHAVHKPGDVLGIRQPKLENTEHRNSPVSSRSSSPKPDFGLLKEQVATRINKARETTSF